ncbi:flavin reductase family protein [Acetobacter sacchari]|uniref:Flavin reductase family protein n=1 Tax=Acetobacter sacchari TaxID=2661687 RepID=A0ABS3LXT9_9PROT|nr:flavin reductase family protein [Acetobacter sacchari]MBO1360735.1 flavin reductase family protein [Acetobacter sacchari]
MTESDQFHSYVPAEGHGLKHDPFNAIVGPRPIGWISTLSPDGAPNLAPYSFFNAFNYTPPIIGFSSTGWKDTVANIEKTGEFVWNLVTRTLAERMNITSAVVPPDVSEFALGHIRSTPSDIVRPTRVADSPVQFECRLTQMVQLKDADGRALETWMTFGEVVKAHIRADLVASGVYDTVAARPVLRAGGPADYYEIRTDSLFQMRRPQGDELTKLLDGHHVTD